MLCECPVLPPAATPALPPWDSVPSPTYSTLPATAITTPPAPTSPAVLPTTAHHHDLFPPTSRRRIASAPSPAVCAPSSPTLTPTEFPPSPTLPPHPSHLLLPAHGAKP